jgi:hypothetical protein
MSHYDNAAKLAEAVVKHRDDGDVRDREEALKIAEVEALLEIAVQLRRCADALRKAAK